MGIDYHALNFLRYARKRRGPFGRVATMGRQSLYIDRATMRRVTGMPQLESRSGEFCERLLTDAFGASLVESFDASAFEGATFVRDLNRPINHDRQYDTVIDCGTSEHVFDVARALRNVVELCVPGGQIIHVLPADNWNGHGFWQFSPELFFSLYSARNGFADTEVFLAELRNYHLWYRVPQPQGGARVEFGSRSRVYVMATTRKVAEVAELVVQQSDYEQAWARGVSNQIFLSELPAEAAARGGVLQRLKALVDRHPALSQRLRGLVYEVETTLTDLRSTRFLSRRCDQFDAVPISNLVA